MFTKISISISFAIFTVNADSIINYYMAKGTNNMIEFTTRLNSNNNDNNKNNNNNNDSNSINGRNNTNAVTQFLLKNTS